MSKHLKYSIAMLLVISSAVAVMIVGVELYFRNSKKFANYWERNGLDYDPARVERVAEPWLWLHSKNVRWTENKSEFSQEFSSNSEGLSGEQLPLEAGKDEFRIIAVGDSFTEGVGDLENLGYVGRLRRLLAKQKAPPRFRVMNAGVDGSDPVFGFELIRRKLLKYKPSLILLTVNDSDIEDVKRRGGVDERFNSDGSLKSRLPKWSWFFNRSHLVRAFVLDVLHFNWELQSPQKTAQETQKAVAGIVQAGVLADQAASGIGCQLLVIVHPHWGEVLSGKLRPELVKVEEGLQKNHVDFADLLDEFTSEIPQPINTDYYWPQDAHYTAKGYQVFARAIEKELKKRKIVRE